MLNYYIFEIFIIDQINKYFYHFKSKNDFTNEFNFTSELLYGKGAFGIVKECLS